MNAGKRGWTGLLLAAAVVAAAVGPPRPAAAAQDQEKRWIDVLTSPAPPNQKDEACQRLKQIGTARAVAALAALLTDEGLSHSARHALESMPCPEAGQALVDALGRTAGRVRLGIISSLGERRAATGSARLACPESSTPALAALLADADPATASAAATALGKIGGAEALRALRAAMPRAPAAVRGALADAILLCADRMLAEGDGKGASAVYRELYESGGPRHVRVAAWRGLALGSDDGGVAMVAGALVGDDLAARQAALQLAPDLPGPAATNALTAALPKAAPEVQPALLAALERRGDPAAAPAVLVAARSADPAVRLGAIRALAALGDGSSVPLLAEVAASGDGPQQKAARQALAQLRRGDVRRAILSLLPKAAPAVQVELTRALGARRDEAAVPALLEMAGGGSAEADVAASALRALAVLADDGRANDIIRILLDAKSDGIRQCAEEALTAISARSGRPRALTGVVVSAIGRASAPAKGPLLRLAARLGGPEAMAALRAAVGDRDAEVRGAAIRAMADGSGPEAADDLLGLARQAADATDRAVALRGYWRVVGLAAGRSADERLRMCQAGLTAAQRPEERRLGLAELAKVPHLDALKLAEGLCGDRTVGPEAEIACIRLAVLLAPAHGAEAKAVLARLADAAKDQAARDEARKALDALDQFAGYVTTWLAAGPYRQEGKQCQQLFDIPFGPEKPGEKVVWKAVPAPADPAAPGQVDLLGICGGDQCVVYLKARIFAPKARRVRLEIGTDDGNKVWLNGKLVHAKNVMRPLKPAEDTAEADLCEGWNDLLMKVTQNNMGCGACLRVRGADGRAVEGLRFDAASP